MATVDRPGTLRLRCVHVARQVSLALAGVRIRQWPAFASASGQRDRPVPAWQCVDQDTSWPAGYSGLA
jgi:hypothetical protein